jgi:ribose-phosphate pyrophosphokinase
MASQQLWEAGATSVMALVTHGILSGPALTRIEESQLQLLVTTNTIPQGPLAAKCDKIKQLDVSHVLAETIRRSHFGESVSYL